MQLGIVGVLYMGMGNMNIQGTVFKSNEDKNLGGAVCVTFRLKIPTPLPSPVPLAA